MIKLKDLLKENSPGFENRQCGDPLPTLRDIAKKYQEGKESVNEKTGGEKTYKSLMKLRTGITNLEKTFKSDEKDMQRDKASKIKSHIGDLQRAWASIWSDFKGQ